MKRLILLALTTLLPAGLPATAFAQLSATSMRISVDGGDPRFYPTYGHLSSSDLYAPLRAEELGLQLRFAGADAEAWVKGEKRAVWTIVRSASGISGLSKTPVVLVMGSSTYLPVRATAALLGRGVEWDPAAKVLRVGSGATGATGAKAAAPQRPAGGTREPVPSAGPARRGVASSTCAPYQVAAGPRADTRAPDALAIAAGAAGIVARASRGSLPLQSAGTFAHAGLRAASAQPPIRAVVRRGSPVARGTLAFRGGTVRRSLQEIVGVPGQGRLEGKVICVDAGHGGQSSGAVSLNGRLEKEICLAIAGEVARSLQESGATVIMPRVDDTTVSLDERIDFANGQNAELFISIHCNAMPAHNTMSGTETYYYTPQSVALARAIHPQVVRVVADRDGGIRRRGFAVIRRTIMPSVLVEVAYIDNLKDEAKLAHPDFQRRAGEAIRDGVLRYYGPSE